MVDLTIIIPTYNGADTLVQLTSELKGKLESLDLDWEIIFIDDHSNDKSFEYIKQMSHQNDRVKGIRLSNNYGQQNAVYCGLQHAMGDLIITMDDDLQHPLELLGQLIYKINQGFDIVYAVNRSKSRPLLLRFGTWLNDIFFTLFIKKPRKIEIGSYRIMTKRLVNMLIDSRTQFVYISALLFRCKPKVYSFRYEPNVKSIKTNTRINLLSRLNLFCKLLKNYGPTSSFTEKLGEPYTIEEKL